MDSIQTLAETLALLQGQEPPARPEPEVDSEPFAAEASEVDGVADEGMGDGVDGALRDSRYDGDPISGTWVEDEDEEESQDAWALTDRAGERY